ESSHRSTIHEILEAAFVRVRGRLGRDRAPCTRATATIETQHRHDRLLRFRIWRCGRLWRRREPWHGDAQPRPPGRRGNAVLLILRAAELHSRARSDADRTNSEPKWHDHRRFPGGRRGLGGGLWARAL